MDYLVTDLKDADVNRSPEGNKSINKPKLACIIHAMIPREDAFGKQHGAVERQERETVPGSCTDSTDRLYGAGPGSPLCCTPHHLHLQDRPDYRTAPVPFCLNPLGFQSSGHYSWETTFSASVKIQRNCPLCLIQWQLTRGVLRLAHKWLEVNLPLGS